MNNSTTPAKQSEHDLDSRRDERTLLRRDALDRLEWRRIEEALANLAIYPATGLRCLAIDPFSMAAEERDWYLQATQEMLGLLEQGEPFSLEPIDFSAFAPDLSRQSVMSAASLAEVMRLATTLQGVSDFLRRTNSSRERAEATFRQMPVLLALLGQIRAVPALQNQLKRSIGEDGSILPTASPALHSACARLENAKRKIASSVQELLQKSYIRQALQEPIWMIRDDRYVLPVRVDRRQDVSGIAHGFSNSGQTIFIEPQELSSAQAALHEAEVEVQVEQARVLRVLSEECHHAADDLLLGIEVLERYDEVRARSKLAGILRAVRPQFVDCQATGIKFRLLEARHPLFPLENRECVANDLVLEPNWEQSFQAASANNADIKHIWVLTGPNAGGKTVAMKTVGLCVAMALSGLFVPAREALLAEFSDLFVELGDRQSREDDLSTFSGHLAHVKKIMSHADVLSLVLLDEGFVGTDPAVGMALARATLEHLADRSVTVIITTHFSNLKILANDDSRFLNASMEFEKAELRPTYRLLNGFPGQSFALELAQRLSFPQEILASARNYYGSEQHRVELLLADLQEKRHQLQQEFAEQCSLRNKMQESLQSLQREKKSFLELRDSLVGSYREKLQKRLNAYENRLFTRERQFDRSREKLLQDLEAEKAHLSKQSPAGAELAIALVTGSAAPPEVPLSVSGPAHPLPPSSSGDRPRKLTDFAQLQQVTIKHKSSASKKGITRPNLAAHSESAEPAELHDLKDIEPRQVTPRSLLDEARASLDEMRREMDNVEDNWQSEVAALFGLTSSLEGKARKEVEAAAAPAVRPASYWQPGMRVRTPQFKETGEVLRPADGKGIVECKFGALRVKIGYAELIAPQSKGEAAIHRPTKITPAVHHPNKSSHQNQNQNQIDLTIEGTLQHSANTLDIRGITVDEALAKLSLFLDKSFRNDQDRVVIIHGHGTGRVKQGVREWLKSCSYELSFRPGISGEGGDGVTVVQLG